jgi:rRNA maturation RNase YbeY
MVANRQRRVRMPIASVEKFFLRACRALRVSPDSVTVCFVSDPVMARWNARYRAKRGPTDVLSFPSVFDGASSGRNESARALPFRGSRLQPRHRQPPKRKGASVPEVPSNSGAEEIYLGDLAIAPAVARRNARRFRRTFDSELRILILHGMLHLLGYDHETDHGRMERRETRLRRSLGLS